MLLVPVSAMSDERLPLSVLDLRELTTLEGRILVHGEEESGRSYLMLEGTDAQVHYVYYTPEMEAARSGGGLCTNSFVRLRKLLNEGRPVLRLTSWAMLNRFCTTSSTFARPRSVLSSVALSLKMAAGVGGSVAIRRRLGRPLSR